MVFSNFANIFSQIVNFLKSRLRALLTIAGAIVLLSASSSCSDNDYNELPREIQEFINAYYPGQGVAGYNVSHGEYTVNLDNSATLLFNASYYWVTLNGNGNTLPQQFLYDNFPATLYDYVVTTDNLNEVYAVTRGGGIYTVTFHNYIIDYDITSETITPVTAPAA